MATLFQMTEANTAAIAQLQADVESLKMTTGTDFGPAIAAVDTKVDALAALVGTPTPPAA